MPVDAPTPAAPQKTGLLAQFEQHQLWAMQSQSAIHDHIAGEATALNERCDKVFQHIDARLAVVEAGLANLMRLVVGEDQSGPGQQAKELRDLAAAESVRPVDIAGAVERLNKTAALIEETAWAMVDAVQSPGGKTRLRERANKIARAELKLVNPSHPKHGTKMTPAKPKTKAKAGSRR